MIQITRLNDTEIIVNADLIEVIEATPDTVITLIDGTRFVVREPPDELVDRIQRYRAGLLALRDDPVLRREPQAPAGLSVAPAGSASLAEAWRRRCSSRDFCGMARVTARMLSRRRNS